MERSAVDPLAIERTAELMARARRLLAYGGFDGVVRRPLYGAGGRVFPQFAAGSEGCELIDTTGQRFVDWVNGWGPVLLGHRHPVVEQAIRDQLAAGPTLSLMHPIEVEVAERIHAMFPAAEMVAFGKNGSDAMTAAARVARAVTGRETILHYGMHGFHDWTICTQPWVRGIPAGLREQIHSFPYNDLDALEALLEAHDVAAVVMEPVREILPERGYLEGVKRLTRDHGALLVFDEIVTALRVANGGAQELYGVVPDLAALGKSLGNGMPLSAIVGRRDLMQTLPAVGFGMTFRGETLSLAAARAVLDFVAANRVAQRLGETGEALRHGFDALARARGVDCRLAGPPQRMTFVFRDAPGMDHEAQRALFLQESLERCVFTNGNILPSFAHDAAAIERSLAGFAGALDALAGALGGSGWRAQAATGFIESIEAVPQGLRVAGWMLLDDGAPDSVAIDGDGARLAADRVDRPDLAAAFPRLARAGRGGFSVLLPAARFVRDGTADFTLCALRAGRVAFRCRVVRRPDAPPSPGPRSIADGVLYL